MLPTVNGVNRRGHILQLQPIQNQRFISPTGKFNNIPKSQPA